MYAQLALPSAGRAALRQRKGLESPHSLRWYVRRELWLAGSLQGCVKSWTPARASLPSHPLCQRVGKPRRTARGCAVPHGGTDRQTDRQTAAATSPPHLGEEGRGGDPLAVEHAAQRRDEVLDDQGQPGPGVACHGAAGRRGRVTHTGTGSARANSAKLGSKRKKTQHWEQTSSQIDSTGVTGGQELRDACACRPRDPRAERGEALAPSPAPRGCQRVGAHRVPLLTAPAGPAGPAAKVQAAPSPVGSSPRPSGATQAPGEPGSPHPLSASPCPAAATAWTNPKQFHILPTHILVSVPRGCWQGDPRCPD